MGTTRILERRIRLVIVFLGFKMFIARIIIIIVRLIIILIVRRIMRRFRI